MIKLLASVVISLPFLIGGNSLFASGEQVNYFSDKTNYPIYPMNSVQNTNDKSVTGIQYAQYYRHNHYQRHGWQHRHHRHHRHNWYYHGHRHCWIGYDGYRHCRRW